MGNCGEPPGTEARCTTTRKEDTAANQEKIFLLIIPSYSNFTNSVNLYNTSESETYKKSAGNI